MEWVEGSSLDQWKELVEPYSEELGYADAQELVLAWLQQSCDAFSALHRVGLVHGGVSLKNIIEGSGKLILTDFDLVQQVGAEETTPGTPAYSAALDNLATASRDIFALAASFFHLIWGTEPFQFDGQFRKYQGLNWESVESEGLEIVCDFLNLATNPSAGQRFDNALDASRWLDEKVRERNKNLGREEDSDTSEDAELESAGDNEAEDPLAIVDSTENVLTNNTVDWLQQVLQSYFGSCNGNAETRGLDSQFTFETFVETKLESKLLEDIRSQKVSLVILYGNAGDGKTAFLQHLAIKLDLPKSPSKKRVWKTTVGGRTIMANLDGSASYQGGSSPESVGRNRL
jgi:serine/threonine protein kinase